MWERRWFAVGYLRVGALDNKGVTDAKQILDSLSADELRQRIEAIDREQQALRVLLRAALRLERQRQGMEIKSAARAEAEQLTDGEITQ